MKKTTLALAAIAVLALSACDDGAHDRIQITKEDEAQINSDAKSETLKRLSQDQEECKEFLRQMKEKDPKFVDAYYRINNRGNKEMVLVKDLGDGNMVEYPAFEANNLPGAGTGKPATTSSSGGQSATASDSSLMPALAGGLLAGAVMGYMANNALQGTTRPRMAQEEEKRRATSSYGGHVASTNQTWARQQATTRAAARASGSYSSPTAKTGAFGGGGARAGGYASGGVGAGASGG